MISPCYITFDHKGISSQDLRHNKWWLMSPCTWLESAFYTFLQNIWSLQYFGSALTFYPCSGAPGLQRLIGIINFMIGKINNFEIQIQICKLAKTCDFSWRSSWRFMIADSQWASLVINSLYINSDMQIKWDINAMKVQISNSKIYMFMFWLRFFWYDHQIN